MKLINHKTKFLHRKGFRGRWLSAYLHRYTGELEETRRFHAHPWTLALSIILKGGFFEFRPNKSLGIQRQGGSFDWYTKNYYHRVMCGRGMSLFIGFNRSQISCPNATVKVKEGYAHYSELCQETEQQSVPVTSLENYE